MKNILNTYTVIFLCFFPFGAWAGCVEGVSAIGPAHVRVGTGGYWSQKTQMSGFTEGHFRWVVQQHWKESEILRNELWVEIYHTETNYFFGERNAYVGCIDYSNFKGKDYKYIKTVNIRYDEEAKKTFLEIEMTNKISKDKPDTEAIEIKYDGPFI